MRRLVVPFRQPNAPRGYRYQSLDVPAPAMRDGMIVVYREGLTPMNPIGVHHHYIAPIRLAQIATPSRRCAPAA